MAQIIRDNDLTALLGARMGTGLGEGFEKTVGGGLRSILQSKLQQMAAESMYDSMGKSFEQMGLPKELSRLPERAQAELLRELAPIIIDNLRAGNKQGPQGVSGIDALAQLLQSPKLQQNSMQQEQQPIQQQAAQPQMQDQVQQMISQQAQQQMPTQAQQPYRPLTRTERERQRQDELIQRKEKIEMDKEARLQAREMQKEERKQEWEAQKMYKDDYKSLTTAANSARKQQEDLDRMIKLVNDGNLNSRLATSIGNNLKFGLKFKVAGIPIRAPGFNADFLYKTADTEEFEKLSANFMRGAKEVFGARVTNADLSAYKKMIPTMAQSDEGKKRIIEYFKVFNDSVIARYEAAQEILRENNGKFPVNFNFLLEERLAPRLDKLYKDFRDFQYKQDEKRKREVNPNADAYGAIQEYIKETL